MVCCGLLMWPKVRRGAYQAIADYVPAKFRLSDFRTIVGAESKTYTFWIPPHVGKLTAPVTPFPALNKYIPPGVAAETGHHVDKRYPGQFTTLVDAPLATL